jgi:hypothetical protein
MTINNLKDFNAYIDLLASEWDGVQDLHDFCHEQADGSEYVIYYANAWDLVTMMRLSDRSILDDAELALENMSMSDSLDTTMCLLAYEIIYQQLSLAVQELEEA